MITDEDILKSLFSKEVKRFRVNRPKKLSQERMSEHLHMSRRSYVNLEYGKSCPDGTTLLQFLSLLTDSEILQMVHAYRDRQADNES